jgi:hypothetical protein
MAITNKVIKRNRQWEIIPDSRILFVLGQSMSMVIAKDAPQRSAANFGSVLVRCTEVEKLKGTRRSRPADITRRTESGRTGSAKCIFKIRPHGDAA